MEIFTTIADTQSYLKKLTQQGKSVGFVPTMGALHRGHISLLQQANLENDIVACSIFVNPIQFNKQEDLLKYPRTLNEDIAKLKEVACDVLFAPSVDEMYPEPALERFDFGHLDKVMEGKHRPGHFNGVAIVVKKLFEIVNPNRAYFGLKDFQQLKIIQTMVSTLKLNVQIVPCPTLRENDGLAMSSRNIRLSKHERSVAPAIYRVLNGIKEKAGRISPKNAEEWGISQLNKFDGMNVEYLSIVGADDLLPISEWDEKKSVVVCTAVNLGAVRLIDNLILNHHIEE
ncbi:MAG: pantoate--beta-alanine ligase [Bacteroidales bacterium]|nr:pantoate--beta-alanine ligase [Bacteroidales bacterium]